jgi:hypothetical protein
MDPLVKPEDDAVGVMDPLVKPEDDAVGVMDPLVKPEDDAVGGRMTRWDFFMLLIQFAP